MDERLRENFFGALMRLKKIESAFSSECEIQMNELAILQMIAGKCACSERPGINLDVPGIQGRLHISKPAVSYILNALEKKEYITREIDARDRRKIAISATPEGIAAAGEGTEKCDRLWARLLEAFGEDEMYTLLALLSRLTDIFEKMNSENA